MARRVTLLPLEQGNQRLGGTALGQGFAQIAAQAFVVLPGQFTAVARVGVHHAHAGQQDRLGLQQADQVGLVDERRIEVLGVGVAAHPRAAAPVGTGRWPRAQGLADLAAGKGDVVDCAIAPDGDLQAGAQRIGDRYPHPMQSTGKTVGATGLLVELATGMQPREDDLDHRHLLLRMQADRNAAPIVLDGDRPVEFHSHRDLATGTGKRLVGRVVDHLLHQVQRAVGAGVHARALPDRLESLENADRGFAVIAF